MSEDEITVTCRRSNDTAMYIWVMGESKRERFKLSIPNTKGGLQVA